MQDKSGVVENKNGRGRGRARGRPAKKPGYDPEELMTELMDTVVEVYNTTHEIKATALELDLSPNKVKKLLITAGVVSYPETEQIQWLLRTGKTMAEVGEEMHLSRAAINTYLPYSKVIYKMSEVSRNAERAKKYKERGRAVRSLGQSLHDAADGAAEDALWQCIIVFQSYPFRTSSGLPFTYTVKRGRDGSYTGELIVSRKEGSKTLTRSSIMLAFHRVMERNGERGEGGAGDAPEYSGPKAIGQIFGISYIYSLFWRFGVIEVPERIVGRMRRIRSREDK